MFESGQVGKWVNDDTDQEVMLAVVFWEDKWAIESNNRHS